MTMHAHPDQTPWSQPGARTLVSADSGIITVSLAKIRIGRERSKPLLTRGNGKLPDALADVDNSLWGDLPLIGYANFEDVSAHDHSLPTVGSTNHIEPVEGRFALQFRAEARFCCRSRTQMTDQTRKVDQVVGDPDNDG